MGAAQPAQNAETIGVTAIERPSRAPSSPVYAGRAADDDPEAFAGGATDRNVARQLLQWLIIFAVVGVPIVGAKWWNARQSAAIAALTSTPPRVADVIVDELPAASGVRETAPRMLPAAQIVERTDAAGSSSTVQAAGTASSPITAQAPLAVTDAPVVRAPAQVPYPTRTRDVAPAIPEGAATQRGIAVLSVLIDTRGNVVEVELLRSIDPALDAAAVAAARQWTFEPTTRDGEPVAVRSNFSVPFGY